MNHKYLGTMLIILLAAAGLSSVGQPNLLAPVNAEAGVLEPRAFLPLVFLPNLEPAFIGEPTTGVVPLTVSFTNQSTGGFSASLWNFGDGESSMLPNPSHVYAAAGVFSVTLTISRATSSASLTRADYITVTVPLRNGSFEDGWVDLPPVGTLINQQPNAWSLRWVQPGMPLYDSDDVAGGVPECVHKHSTQLPPDEQLGGVEALILDGEYTYKMFHANQPFGAELEQTSLSLPRGSVWRLKVPILVDLHDSPSDPYMAESGVWVNGIGGWANAAEMGNRNWYTHAIEFSVPSDGEITVLIRVKSKWATPKDFFVDNVSLQMLTYGDVSAASIVEEP